MVKKYRSSHKTSGTFDKELSNLRENLETLKKQDKINQDCFIKQLEDILNILDLLSSKSRSIEAAALECSQHIEKNKKSLYKFPKAKNFARTIIAKKNSNKLEWKGEIDELKNMCKHLTSHQKPNTPIKTALDKDILPNSWEEYYDDPPMITHEDLTTTHEDVGEGACDGVLPNSPSNPKDLSASPIDSLKTMMIKAIQIIGKTLDSAEKYKQSIEDKLKVLEGIALENPAVRELANIHKDNKQSACSR